MEKQDLDNLQQTTKEYSQSGLWLSTIIQGVFYVICGLMMYFKFVWWDLLFWVGVLCWFFVSKYLNRNIMRKGLGYVKQKEEKAKFSWGKVLPIALLWIVFMLFFIVKNWDKNTIYPVMFLGTGVVAIILGLINREKTFFNSAFYGGVVLIACAIMLWVFPIKRILYAHGISPWAIVFIFLGLVAIFSGVIDYFKYKKIVQKVKETN